MPPVAAATALPVKTAIAAGASNKPKQTLEEMAAWLDAQLAAAPGNALMTLYTMDCTVAVCRTVMAFVGYAQSMC